LQHQCQAFVLPYPLEPAEEERGGDVIREVRNDLSGFPGKHRRVEFERITCDKIEAPRISRSKLAERSETPPVSLYRDNVARPECKQRPCQTAGAGTDLDDGGLVEPSRCSCDPTRQVEVEQEILAEALVRDDPVPRDDLA
jgi:hypothetical protein